MKEVFLSSKKKGKVTLSVNIFERTYKNILKKNFFNAIEKSVNFRFDEVHVIVNNVSNRKLISSLLDKLINQKLITSYYFVEDYIDDALDCFNLSKEFLGPKPYCYYSNHLYVAIYLTKTEFLFHYDPDIIMMKSGNFIKDSIDIMSKDKNIFVTMPIPEKFVPNETDFLINENFYYYFIFFSDPIFFINTNDFCCDIYRYKTVGSFLRHSLSYIFPIFEERVESYMRIHKKFLALHTNSMFSQPNEGQNYSRDSFYQRLKRYYKILLWYLFIMIKPKNLKYMIVEDQKYIARVIKSKD